MLNLIISLLVSTVVAVCVNTFAGVHVWVAAGVSLAVFTVLYIVTTRVVMKKIAVLMDSAQRDLQAGRPEKAIKILESGFKYSNWQFYIKPQINAQIGTIYYMQRNFTKAFDYLQKGFVRHWVAMAMLGITYMKRNKTTEMINTFEKATTGSRKEPMVWNLYAYCLEKVGDTEKAIAVMEKGLKKTGGDERLEANLEALREGRKMKMKGYGDMWYQFHLEKPGALVKKQTRAVQGRRKIVRR